MQPSDGTTGEAPDRRRRRLDRIARLAAAGGDHHDDRRDVDGSSDRSADAPPPAESPGPEIGLPDGTRHPIHATTVIGRRPDPTAARETGALTLELDAATSVSRTHLCVRRDGERLLVNDCASSAGTVLVRAADPEPVPLRPWENVVVDDGDRLYLGSEATVLSVHGA